MPCQAVFVVSYRFIILASFMETSAWSFMLFLLIYVCVFSSFQAFLFGVKYRFPCQTTLEFLGQILLLEFMVLLLAKVSPNVLMKDYLILVQGIGNVHIWL